MKKGRHRRFEEARQFKRSSTDIDLGDLGFKATQACPECGCLPGTAHAAWCLAEDAAAVDDTAVEDELLDGS